MRKNTHQNFQYIKTNDKSVCSVRITKDGKFFADILFLDFYLNEEQLKKRGAENPKGTMLIPHPSTGPLAEKQQKLIKYYLIDMLPKHVESIPIYFSRFLTEALNNFEARFFSPKKQRKWISFAPEYNRDLLRISRDIGS